MTDRYLGELILELYLEDKASTEWSDDEEHGADAWNQGNKHSRGSIRIRVFTLYDILNVPIKFIELFITKCRNVNGHTFSCKYHQNI
jgi:hypothetical protein